MPPMAPDSELDLSTSTADEDLRAALGISNPWDGESTTDSAEVGTSEQTVEDAADTTVDDTDAPDAPAELGDEEVSRVLNHPRVQSQLRDIFTRTSASQIAEARKLWEAELAMQKAQEDDLLLDDEEYGRRQRDMQKLAPRLQQAQQAGYVQAQADFFKMAVGSVWQTVEELRSLPDAEKNALDPADPRFKSYGEYISAVVDVAATARAKKQAQKLANEIAEARVQSELGKLRKSSPSPLSVAGPASGPGPIIDLDKMSGDDLLKLAFKN